MIALLAAAAVTFAAPVAPSEFELPMGRVRIEATKLEVIKASEVVASGGIFLTAPGIRIRAEDRIVAVNRIRIRNLAQLREVTKDQTSMLVQLQRGNQTLILPLR